MSLLERLRSAYEAFQGREYPVNDGHRFCVKTLDTSYYADDVRCNPMTGDPEWVYRGNVHTLVCKRIDNAVIYDYKGEWP